MTKNSVFFEQDRIRIINDSVLKTTKIDDGSIDLVITSPPYNVDIKYNSHNDRISYEQYKEFSRKWMERCFNWLKDGGRFCLNIPLDKNKGGQQSVGADLTRIAKEVIKFNYHSTIVWNEGNISRRTAWGSWMSPSAPYVIAPVELIVVLYKGDWKRPPNGREADIDRKNFIDWTNGLWTFSGESKKKIKHPAPFPVELPRRCMKLFSYKGDTILDPFLGSGTTLVASYLNNRIGIGIDIDPYYCQIALDRLKKEAGLSLKNGKTTPTQSQSDIILQHFKDHPSEPMHYSDVGKWIKEEVKKQSFKDIKAYEKIMRDLAKEGKITKLESCFFVYD